MEQTAARTPRLVEVLRARARRALFGAPSPPAPVDVSAGPPDAFEFVAPGHYYSALPSQAGVARRAPSLFGPPPRTLKGLDLREPQQLALLHALEPYYDSQPFPATRTPPLRYWFDNPSYSWSDALFLHAMLRHLRPRSVVEIGSGYSSCVTLDTSELFLGGAVECTFVEPHPELLRSLLRPGDEGRVRLVAAEVQDAPMGVFEALGANDVLFIDSTHVSKVGSDVNHLVLEVLPRLAPGVHVHFHDVFHPFEYPEHWVRSGHAWNEAYLLRAFLTMNAAYEVVLFNTFLEHFHEDYFVRRMPLCLRNRGGSIWIRRRA